MKAIVKIKPSQSRTSVLRDFGGPRQVARARAMRARRVSARRLLAPDQLQASLRLTPLLSLWMSCVAGLQSALAVLVAAVFLTSLASLLGAPGYMLVLVVALVAGVASVGFSYWKLGGPGAVIIVFAAGAAMSPVESWQVFGERVVATVAGGVVAWLVTSATDFLRLKELSRIHPPQEAARPFRNILLSALPWVPPWPPWWPMQPAGTTLHGRQLAQWR